jgi:hypothetical protein
MKPFAAEVVVSDSADVARVAAAVTAAECAFRTVPAKNAEEPAVFGVITGMTELAEDEIADWLNHIVGPLGGDVDLCRYGSSDWCWRS